MGLLCHCVAELLELEAILAGADLDGDVAVALHRFDAGVVRSLRLPLFQIVLPSSRT